MHDDGRRFASKHSCCHGEIFSNLQRVHHLHNFYQRDSDLCNNPIYEYVSSPIVDTAVATVRHFQIYRGSPIFTISINAILTYATIPYMNMCRHQSLMHSCCHCETFSNLQRIPHLHNFYYPDSRICNNLIYGFVSLPIVDKQLLPL